MMHIPVLMNEVIECFNPLSLSFFFDGTLGAGGHAAALLEAHPEIACYIGVDQDEYALSVAKERLKTWSRRVLLKHANFSMLDNLLKEQSIIGVSGILVDLGVSSMQLDQRDRGFSFMQEGPLDMRMDTTGSQTAADIVNEWTEKELGLIFRKYGEEKQWRAAARAIVNAREQSPFKTTLDLKKVLLPVLSRHPKKGINPLTLVFQALRIAVNRELEVLELFLPKAIDLLEPGGRLAVISFHSLEDRIVKEAMRFAASDKWDTSGIGGVFLDKKPLVKLITKKPIEAALSEIESNPRSRSAKLRICEKL